jgi:hypothetical protein
MKIRLGGAKSFHEGGETNMKKQQVAFRTFVKVHKMHDNFSNTVHGHLKTVQNTADKSSITALCCKGKFFRHFSARQ